MRPPEWAAFAANVAAQPDFEKAVGRLSGRASFRRPGVTGAATATFVYDGDGNRVKGTAAGVTTTYLGNYYEWNGSAGVKNYYAGSERVAMHDAAGTLYFLLGDQLGSTSKVATSSGTFYSEIRYGPWGTTRYSNGQACRIAGIW